MMVVVVSNSGVVVSTADDDSSVDGVAKDDVANANVDVSSVAVIFCKASAVGSNSVMGAVVVVDVALMPVAAVVVVMLASSPNDFSTIDVG